MSGRNVPQIPWTVTCVPTGPWSGCRAKLGVIGGGCFRTGGGGGAADAADAPKATNAETTTARATRRSRPEGRNIRIWSILPVPREPLSRSREAVHRGRYGSTGDGAAVARYPSSV